MYEKLKKWKERCDKKEEVSFSLSHNHSGNISYFLHGKVGGKRWCILVDSDSVRYEILESLI